MIKNIIKYNFLITQLVLRDIKIRYRRSILGILWSILNPLFFTLIVYIVFSSIFKSDIKNFALYVMIGQVIFSFFVESSMSAMDAIVSNGALIKKVYIPKYIFPIARVISSFINMCFSLLALLLVIFITGAKFYISYTFLPLLFLYLFIFCIGIGLILASINVFFRDTRHLYTILITALSYISAIYYPISIIPKNYRDVLSLNPIYKFIEFGRELIINGNFPTFKSNLICFIIAIIFLLVGIFVFKRSENKFIFYI